MCLECRILGAVAHHDRAGSLQLVHKFSAFDFRPLPSEVKEYLIDTQSEVFLKETLEMLKKTAGVELKVIKVDSDGSCLPYAVSRCLIGKEILYDALREALFHELSTNEEFYASLFRQSMDETTWKVHWTNLLEEARPTRGARTGRWLGPGEHLVAMANVIARPILLLDEWQSMQRFDGVSSGLFLPLRLSRAQVLERNSGQCPSPVVIAWANDKRNHFVALIRTMPTKEEHRDLFLSEGFLSKEAAIAIERTCFKAESDKVTLNERNLLRKMEMPLQVPTSGPSEYVSLKDSETGEEIKIAVPASAKPGSTFQASFMRPPGRLERQWMRLLLENASTARTRAITTLKLIVENLVDAYLSGDFARVGKVSKLKLDNAMVRGNIIPANGALEFLLAVGFERKDQTSIDFGHFDESLVLARDALRVLAVEVKALRDAEGEVKAGSEPSVFGPKPACFVVKNDEAAWAEARQEYGFDGLDAGKNAVQVRREAGVWVFSSTGISLERERKEAVDALMASLRGDFEALSEGSEAERVDWDDVLLYNKRLMHVRCPECSHDQEWTGPVDGLNAEVHSQACAKCSKPLKASMTGARKLLHFVSSCALEGDLGATRCDKCTKLRLGRDEAVQCKPCIAIKS